MGKMRQFRRALQAAIGHPLAFSMKDGFGLVASALLENVARGARVHDDEIFEVFGNPSEARPFGLSGEIQGGRKLAMEDGDGPSSRLQYVAMPPMIIPATEGTKATAVVTMRGIALYDYEYQPLCFSTRLFAQTIMQLAAMPDIGTILIDIDTPGGSVTGVKEAGNALFAAAKKKHIVALVNPLCASAGYYIASQASEIVAIPSADVGSIGVFMAHTDCSKFNEQQGLKITYIYAGEHKVEGNPDEPLDPDAKKYYQMQVDTIYSDFIKAVARGRKRDASDVLANFGKGRCMLAGEALSAGLIDQIATIEGTLARFGVAMVPQQVRGRRGESEGDGTQAQGGDETVVIDAGGDREALAFYATESNYIATGPQNDMDPSPVSSDRGRRARLALEGPPSSPVVLRSFAVVGASVDFAGRITLYQEQSEDGARKVFTETPWPEWLLIDRNIVQPENAHVTEHAAGFAFEVANGKAGYMKVAKAGNPSTYLCSLRSGSTYEPRVKAEEEAKEPQADPAADPPSADVTAAEPPSPPQEPPKEPEAQVPGAAALARARRLALLKRSVAHVE